MRCNLKMYFSAFLNSLFLELCETWSQLNARLCRPLKMMLKIISTQQLCQVLVCQVHFTAQLFPRSTLWCCRHFRKCSFCQETKIIFTSNVHINALNTIFATHNFFLTIWSISINVILLPLALFCYFWTIYHFLQFFANFLPFVRLLAVLLLFTS